MSKAYRSGQIAQVGGLIEFAFDSSGMLHISQGKNYIIVYPANLPHLKAVVRDLGEYTHSVTGEKLT